MAVETQSLGDQKRGDYFAFYANLTDALDAPIVLSADLISSQIRDSMGQLIDDLDISADPVPGRYLIEKDDTKTWPIGTLEIDLEMLIDGKPLSTPTFTVRIVRDVTQNA
jgi:hypothetical protein